MADEALPETIDETTALEAVDEGSGPQNFIQNILSDPRQRLRAIIGAAILVVVIVMGIMFAGGDNENKGKLVNLVQELDQARAFEIIAKLKTVNIEATVMPSEIPGEYIVQVYENAVETAYLNLSRTNLLQDDGYGLFDQTDWAASDYDKRIKLVRAINGDLSRIVSRMDGLRAAIVRVQIPEQQLFTEFETPTTATIQVELENDGDELSKTQVKSIINLLRGYVPNLDKDKVSIVDTMGNNYNNFREEEESSADDYIDEIERINKMIKQRVQRYLDEVLGSDKYKVSVSASVSRERIQKQQTVYSEGAVGVRQVGNEALQSGGINPGVVAGPGVGGAGKNYQQATTSETLYPSYEQQQVTYLPGRVTSVSVALAVDKSVAASMSLKQLQESVAAIVGPNTLPESIKLNVIDLAGAGSSIAPSLQQNIIQKSYFLGMVKADSFKDALFRVFSIIGTIFGLLILGIVGLNFLSAASNQQSKRVVDESLGEEFDDVLHEGEDEDAVDFGEKKALDQQESLLREMMNPAGGAATAQAVKPKPTATATQEASPKLEFEGLLNNFQDAAQDKPDILAKKIQMWLDDDEK